MSSIKSYTLLFQGRQRIEKGIIEYWYWIPIIGLVQASKVTNPTEQFSKQKMNRHPKGRKSNIKKNYLCHFNRLLFHFCLVELIFRVKNGERVLGLLSPFSSLEEMFSSYVRTNSDSFLFKDKSNYYASLTVLNQFD